MLSAAVTAIVFVLLMVSTTMITQIVAVYVAHCLSAVIAGTTSFQKGEMVWPKEPFVDWLPDAIAMIGLIYFWLVPAGCFSLILQDTFLRDNIVLRTAIASLICLWLFFPIGSLSLLSSRSRFSFFRPVIVGQMLRILPATLVFYFLSGLVLAITLSPYLLVMFSKGIYLKLFPPAILPAETSFPEPGLIAVDNSLVFVLMVVPWAACGILIYARLLGRLGAMIQAGLPYLADHDETVREKHEKQRKKKLPVRKIQSQPDPDSPYTGEADHVYSENIKKKLSNAYDKEEGDPFSAYDVTGSAKAGEPAKEEGKTHPLPRAYLNPEEDTRMGYGLEKSKSKDKEKSPSGIIVPRPEQFWTPRNRKTEPVAEPKQAEKPKPVKPLLKKKKPLPPPGIDSLVRGVFGFPFHSNIIGSTFGMIFLMTFATILLKATISFYPF